MRGGPSLQLLVGLDGSALMPAVGAALTNASHANCRHLAAATTDVCGPSGVSTTPTNANPSPGNDLMQARGEHSRSGVPGVQPFAGASSLSNRAIWVELPKIASGGPMAPRDTE